MRRARPWVLFRHDNGECACTPCAYNRQRQSVVNGNATSLWNETLAFASEKFIHKGKSDIKTKREEERERKREKDELIANSFVAERKALGCWFS
ncbi:hypothetical protein PUN28_007391 [Cardiocondyla obscurior]|uniref:Uncharacterized protein n=1 Tax=Cardiocondyla obscurior TaxID=286306 RepID=A0AAW2G3M9_9HYME